MGKRTAYKILERIGAGSSATVYRGIHRKTQRVVALKLCREALRNPEAQATFESEMEILMRLQHPHIVQYLEYYNTEERMYIVLEYCPSSLTSYVKEHPEYPVSLVKNWLTQLLDALQYLFVNGIVHRDLKLDNLLLTDSLDIKLTDFGNAREVPQFECMTSFGGTRPYMSPEMLSHSQYTFKSDVWGFGVVAYVLLFRELPFEVKFSGTDFTLKFPSNTPQPIEDFLRRVLIVQPEQRPTFAQIQGCPFFQAEWPEFILETPLPHNEVAILDSRRIELEEGGELIPYYLRKDEIAGLAVLYYVHCGFKELFASLEQLKIRHGIAYFTPETEFANSYELIQRYITLHLLPKYENQLKQLSETAAALYPVFADNLVKVLKVVIRKKGMIKAMVAHVRFVLKVACSFDSSNDEVARLKNHFETVTGTTV